MRNIDVLTGIALTMPGQPARFMCISSFLFDTLEEFQQGMATQSGWIIGDVPNYTNVQTQIQISNLVFAGT